MGITNVGYATLAYGFTHSCEIVYFYGLRADYAAFLAEQGAEPAFAAEPLQSLGPVGESVPKRASAGLPPPVAVGLSRPSLPLPSCPSCGTPYDPADYRPDAVVARCSACRAELRFERER